MPLVPATVSFPEPGTYIRSWKDSEKRYVFMRLVSRQYPLIYPRRIASLASGAKSSSPLLLREVRPSAAKRHRYMAYIGVRPGAFYYFRYPSTDELGRWDEAITEIDRDSTGYITYEESPIDAPTFQIWLEPETILAVDALNVSSRTITPEIKIIAARYVVLEEKDLDSMTLDRLRNEDLSSIQVNFSGSN